MPLILTRDELDEAPDWAAADPLSLAVERILRRPPADVSPRDPAESDLEVATRWASEWCTRELLGHGRSEFV